MTRPQMIRADTIDLQDQSTPSAQDHTRQPTHPAAIGAGPPAPHQAEALRELAAEEEEYRSPDSSDWPNGGHGSANGHYDNQAPAASGDLEQQDTLAIAQNGGLTGSLAEDADMADAEGDDSLDEDDMMDKISSSPSIDDEDIDFEFVYALHTFVATVEGQANATKGDTMVLLDDSNSYWWLVRVVKDSSIGYLPAEHIETPTERLARLNKHRNIDLSAAMLGDQADKPKNPLKKAIRRRNAKTVTFTAPTYVEASDVDYSTDEDEIAERNYYAQEQAQAEAQRIEAEADEITVVETVSERAEVREVKSSIVELGRGISDETSKDSSDTARTSDEMSDGKTDGISRSRNGTIRNTDSFFKDEKVETRKITITPNLLRDDSSTSTRTSNDSKELRQRPSLDKLEKDSFEKTREKKAPKEKKEKEKKPGMLSGLFKRKDKKNKSLDDDIDELILGKKSSNEDARTASPAPSKDSEDNVEDPAVRNRNTSPQRQSSKLQKQPRVDAPMAKPESGQESRPKEALQIPAPDRAPPAINAAEPSMRLVHPDERPQRQQSRSRSPSVTRNPTTSQDVGDDSKSAGGTFAKILRSRSNSTTDPKPEKLKKAKERLELDDSDSLDGISVEEPLREISLSTKKPIPSAFPDSYVSTVNAERTGYVAERLSESPVQVSPIEASRTNPPALMGDTSDQEGASSPISSPSPELIEVDEVHGKKGSDISSTTPTSTSTWSDAHLRTFFDDDSEIRDLLVVVYDKSGVEPAGPDHPITGNLFKAENARLADITSRLDNMLGDWLARKMNSAV